MLRLLVLGSLAAIAIAVPNRMWDGDCGWSALGRDAVPDYIANDRTRVVGGTEATPNSQPWMVSLIWSGSHFCGASVVTANHVITAAHCVAGDNPNQLNVRVGCHHRQQSTDYDETYSVTANDWHPQYDLTGNIENDVAVLTTADMEFNAGVGAICAPEFDQSMDPYAGRDCHTSGWGTTSSGGTSSQVLLYANIEVTTYAVCVNTHPNGWVEPGMVCAGRPDNGWDRDACQGDSGGPLFLWEGDDDDENGWTLIGQVSWGIGCAGQTPGVYADSAYYVDWFNGVIDG